MADVGVLFLRPRATLYRVLAPALARAENTERRDRNTGSGNCQLGS